MGADLIVSLLEFPKGRKKPSWKKAEKLLEKLKKSPKDLRAAWIRAFDDSDLDELRAGQSNVTDEEINSRIIERLEECFVNVRYGWDGGLRGMTLLTGAKTRILVAADRSFGDSCEEVNDIVFFAESGMAKAAGFL
jgi:hypothetical protein